MTANEFTPIIWLTQGKYTIVDIEDYDFLTQWKWKMHLDYAHRIEYMGTFSNKRKFLNIKMHRLIMNTPKGMVTDHIDGNKLNNTRANLRVCTDSQNQANRKITIGSSKYKGVTWDKDANKWRSKITVNWKSIYLGTYYCEREAAKAYNTAAEKFFGEYARLNPV